MLTTDAKRRRKVWLRRRSRMLLLVIERDGWFCAECGVGLYEPRSSVPPWEEGFDDDASSPPPGLKRATVDHIIPISHGGSDDLDNLQLMCMACNLAKGVALA